MPPFRNRPLFDLVLGTCAIFHMTESYPLYLCAGYIPCSLYFCWTLSSDHAVYSTLRRVILLFEFVRAVYKENFSVNFIIDRFSLPY